MQYVEWIVIALASFCIGKRKEKDRTVRVITVLASGFLTPYIFWVVSSGMLTVGERDTG